MTKGNPVDELKAEALARASEQARYEAAVGMGGLLKPA